MGWDEHNQRRAAIRAVIAHAEQNPAAGLPYEALPEVRAVFRDRRELVLALQYDWTQALWARIELLSLDNGRESAGLADARYLAERAWADCTATHPVLRRLLDDYRDELGPALLREQDCVKYA
jgi:hypothetical protein